MAFMLKLEGVSNASLAGMQPKIAVRTHPYLKCYGCQRENRGEIV